MKEHRGMYLFWEVETASKLIKKGMAELQAISDANDFYHVPILLLSSGYERLIKCLLCLASMSEEGEITGMPYTTSGRKGHDLDLLLNTLLKICQEKNYSSKFPAAKIDIDLLTNDKVLREIISIFFNFAQAGRYYNLDIVIKGKSDFKDSKNMWEELEMAIVRSSENISRKYSDPNYRNIKGTYKEINQELIKILEKFARALSRLFTLGDFSNFSKGVSTPLHDFLFLRDEDLGTRDYRKPKIFRKIEKKEDKANRDILMFILGAGAAVIIGIILYSLF